MTTRTVTVYLDEETGTGYYVDCPACHFYKNLDSGVPCRNLHCTYSGVTVKVPVTVNPPLTDLDDAELEIGDIVVDAELSPHSLEWKVVRIDGDWVTAQSLNHTGAMAIYRRPKWRKVR